MSLNWLFFRLSRSLVLILGEGCEHLQDSSIGLLDKSMCLRVSILTIKKGDSNEFYLFNPKFYLGLSFIVYRLSFVSFFWVQDGSTHLGFFELIEFCKFFLSPRWVDPSWIFSLTRVDKLKWVQDGSTHLGLFINGQDGSTRAESPRRVDPRPSWALVQDGS